MFLPSSRELGTNYPAVPEGYAAGNHDGSRAECIQHLDDQLRAASNAPHQTHCGSGCLCCAHVEVQQ